MHGVVLSSATGDVLRPAVIWADTRSTSSLRDYDRLDPGLKQQLANPLVTGMAGPTLLWLRDHEPDVYSRARWALQPKDWLRLVLTGVAASEPSDASATLLYDLEGDTWFWDLVDQLGLRRDMLPPLLPSGAEAGRLSKHAAASLGLLAGLPVASGAGDTAAAAVGTGLLAPGTAQVTVGTAGQIVMIRDSPIVDSTRRTHLFRAATSVGWYAMGAVQNVGLALEWVRAVLGVEWETVYEEAFSVPAGAQGLTFLPHLTGERTPHMDAAARGSWSGLALHHSRAHLLRAALEGVAFSLREALDALEATGSTVPELRLAGGGSTHEAWRQMLADVLQRPLLAVPESAASARGAALLGGMAAGVYAGFDEIAALSPAPVPVARPDAQLEQSYRDAYERFRDLYGRLRGWRCQGLAS
jgi:xylulokinase